MVVLSFLPLVEEVVLFFFLSFIIVESCLPVVEFILVDEVVEFILVVE